jgi:hypothetical protein
MVCCALPHILVVPSPTVRMLGHISSTPPYDPQLQLSRIYLPARCRMCDARYGAVEDMDWRDNSSWGYSQSSEGLRLARQMRLYGALYQAMQPHDEPKLRGDFYLKNVSCLYRSCLHTPRTGCIMLA